MPAPPRPDLSKLGDTLARLERSVRQGDWNATARFTTLLTSETIPQNREALKEYLQRLRGILIEARIGRSGLALSLSRLRAAAKFAHARAFDDRQYSVVPAKS